MNFFHFRKNNLFKIFVIFCLFLAGQFFLTGYKYIKGDDGKIIQVSTEDWSKPNEENSSDESGGSGSSSTVSSEASSSSESSNSGSESSGSGSGSDSDSGSSSSNDSDSNPGSSSGYNTGSDSHSSYEYDSSSSSSDDNSAEAERQRQEELERQRQEELERQRQEELERQRQEELERQRQEELERQRQEELERQRQEEELERQRQEEERKRQEEELERQRQEELERQRQEELERQRQLELERQRQEAEKAQLAAQINQLENELENIPESQAVSTEPLPSIKEEAEEQYDYTEKVQTQEKITKTENIEENKKSLDSVNSSTSGDPVKVSLGSYFQEEVDIIAGQIQVKRFYESDNCVRGSFAYGWTSNLDERIILGWEPAAIKNYQLLLQIKEQLYQSIQNYKNLIMTTFGLTSIENAESEITERIDACNSIENRAKELEPAYGLSPQNVEQAAHQKEKALQTELALLKAYLKELDEAQINYQELCQNFQQYKNNVYEKSLQAMEKNKNALFSGSREELFATGLDTISLIDEEGFPHLLFETEEKSKWKNESEKTIKECCLLSDGYLVTMTDGSQKKFNSDGFIIKIQDRNENYILITRDKDEKIQKITSSDGELLNFTYEGSFIKSIVNSRDPSHSVIYTYKNDLLTAVKDSDGDLVINNYDEEKHLTQLKKCDGSSISFVYGQVTSAGKKLVTATVNEEAYAETFDYDLNKRLTIYTDHDGNSTSYIYDEKFRTRKEVQSNGSVIESFYDDYGNRSKVIQNGNKIEYEYVNNNKTKALYEDSSYEEWTYDSYNQITSYKDRDGIFYEYIRDSKGNLLEYREGGQSLYSQIFDSKGRLTKLTVYGQYPVITEYQYDSFGNIKSESCDGLKKEYLYDKRNRLTKVFNNGSLVSQYSYNGRNITSTDYKGLETSYTINGRKDLTEIIQKDLHSQTIHKKRIEYDKRHLPLRLYLSDGKKEILSALYFYTPFGKLAGQAALPSTGEECWVKLYEYKNGIIAGEKQFKCSLQKLLSLKSVLSQEDVNQLISQAGDDISAKKYDYKIQSGDRLLLTFTDALGTELLFDYDSNGNLVMQQDGNGTVLKRTYTKAGRLQSKETEYGGFYEYKYNPGGNLISYGEGGAVASNAAAATTTTATSTYEYYPDGSLKKTVNPDGQYSLYNYDRRGRLVSIQSQTEQTNYEYDDFDRLVKESNSAAFVTYDYSADGRSLLLTLGGKYKMLYELDAFGNVIKEKDGNGNARRYEYNCRNQLVKAYDAYENLSSYEYNALGLVSLVKQTDGTVTEYQYNYLGLLQKITDDCGLVYKASYDKTGLLLTEKYRGDSEKTYEYDKAGRLIKIICGGQTVESYSYALGNKSLTVSDGLENPYLYNYDSFGRLKSERNRLGNESFYSYDFQGQLKEKKDFNGQTMTIEYSLDNSVKTISYSDGSKILFVYDANGNITQASNSYGKLIYQYDKGGKLIYQKDLAAGEEIFYEYDAAGNRISLKSSFSDIHYTYGKNNELLELYDKKQGIKINLLYDSVGREIQRKFSNQTIQNTYYDRAGRIILITQKSAANELLWGQAYVYGSDGKRSAGIDSKGLVTLYEYNSQGQLAGVWYPYSQELEDKLREEAQENGFAGMKNIGQNKFLSSTERNDLALLLEKMQYGLSFKLSSLQIFIKESFAYDKNGNRISKINDFGKIDYSYDSENRLLFTGMNGKSGVKYSYDCNGNLLTQESALKTKKYAYNSQNRLIYCELIDKVQKTYVRTSYAYDALGRRVLVQDNSEAPLRTVYDGLSFDVIWQGADNINHFNFSGNVPYTADATGRPTGDRYRYLGDEALMDENRYFYLEQGNYKAVSSRYQGARSQLNINACVAAQSRNDGHQFFATDIQGSVSSVTDTYGYQLDSYTYDAFGSVVHGDLSNSSDLGYLSKPYDPSSSLYNYGYRDYSSATSRFTTPDPIRDGPNWFSYCTSDPINFVDLWGLDANDTNTIKFGKNIYSMDYIKRNVPQQFQSAAIKAMQEEEKRGVYGSPTDSKRITEVVGTTTELQLVHTGVDIGALNKDEKGKPIKGDPIYATADGVVLRVGRTNSNSTRIEITLPYTRDTAVYEHAVFNVKTGDSVKRGQIIGYMSDEGTPGNVHLHYEIRKNGKYAGIDGDVELVDPRNHMPSMYYE